MTLANLAGPLGVVTRPNFFTRRNEMQLKPKIVLKEKNSEANLSTGILEAMMGWKTNVDLDLHAFAIAKDGTSRHVYFRNLKAPGIKHSGDEGVGGSIDHEFGNQEKIDVDLSSYSDVVIAANIYSNAQNFGEVGGVVRVKAGDQEFEVPMTEKAKGKWCTIAHLNNTGITPKLRNVNVTTQNQPDINKVINGTITSDAGSSGGFFGKIFR